MAPENRRQPGMNDLTYSARRAIASTVRQVENSRDLSARFRILVQSPLRASILRHLHANPEEQFDVESLMQIFGRMRLDIENCVNELVSACVARRTTEDGLARFSGIRPPNETMAALLDDF